MRYLLILIIVVFLPYGVYGATGKHDDREYVDWSQPPYNKLVQIWTEAGGTCSGQYVAKDIILTARHCITRNKEFDDFERIGTRLTIINNKFEMFTAKVEKYGRQYDEDDWGLLRIVDSDYFSNEYFELSNPNGVPWNQKGRINVMNAGFGYMRILSDKEIKQLRNIFKSIVGKDYMDSNFNATVNKATEEIEKRGIKTLRDIDESNKELKIYRLKAQKKGCLFSTVPVHYVDNCDVFSGNSGGPFFMNNQLFGVLSASVHSFEKEDYSKAIPTKRYFDALMEIMGANKVNVVSTQSVSVDENQTERERDALPTMYSPAEEIEQQVNSIEEQLSNDLKNVSSMADSDFMDFLDRFTQYSILQEQYQRAKLREQSTANKLLGAAAIGATGIGAMQLASGLAERQSDDAAERDMRAYLATFMCDYGAGRNIQGGQTNIELPVASGLLPMVAEYKQLAADLKSRKEALGMLPGIESELVLDIVLHDNTSVGKTYGAFTSLSRALTDENGADAAAWDAQKSDAQNKTKTGAIVGGVGAAGGAVGNLIINKDDKKEDKQ